MAAGADLTPKIVVAAIVVLFGFSAANVALVRMAGGTTENIMQKWAKEEVGSRIGELCKKNEERGPLPEDSNFTRDFPRAEELEVIKSEKAGDHDVWRLAAKEDGSIIWSGKIAERNNDLLSGFAGLIPGNDANGPCEAVAIKDMDSDTSEAEGPGMMKFRIYDNIPSGDIADAPGGSPNNKGDNIEIRVWDADNNQP